MAIKAESADGVVHEFPDGTDTSVIDSAMRTYAQQTMPQPEERPAPEAPKSSLLGGIAKTVGQQALKLPGGVVETAGSTAETAALLDEANSRKQLEIYDRLDSGEKIKPKPSQGLGTSGDQDLITANKYMAADPDEKAALRARAAGNLKAQPGMLEETGQKLRHTGEAMQSWAERQIPMSEEEQGRTSVQVTKMLTSMVPYVAAAVTTGGAGLVGYGALESLNRTYGEALTSGADPEQAAKQAVENGTMQGFINVLPAVHAAKIMARLPEAARGKFASLLADAALGATNMLSISQVSLLADNAIAQKNTEPYRPAAQGIGENLLAPAIAGAILPVGATVAGRVFRPRVNPIEVAKPVLDAPDVDEAITAAKQVVEGPPTPVDTSAPLADTMEYGGAAEQRQAQLNKLFGGLNEGTVEQAPDGSYHYRTDAPGREAITPLKVWEPGTSEVAEGENAITPELAAAQRAHYDRLGVKVVYFENDPGIAFDGAVDPKQPNTIFLSNNPERNAAQVAAHEFTHVLESTTLPDGTNLGDVLHSLVAEGITPEGMSEGGRTFASTAPDRADFPRTPVGDAAHQDAVVNHIIREVGADIGGEAPAFQSFAPRIVEAVEQRYGADVAKGVLQKMIAGIRQTITTLRKFFFKPADGAEYGQPEMASQRWVTNLERIQGVLAQGYAERLTPIERERAKLEAMRPKAAAPPAEAAPRAIPGETAPAGTPALPETAVTAEAPARPVPEVPVAAPMEGRPEPAPPAAYGEAQGRAQRLERRLGELDAERAQKAADSPQARFQEQTIAAILGKVRGVEARLTKAAAERLATARATLEAIRNPEDDNADMALVRTQLEAERQKMADAAAVGTGPAPGTERAGRPQTAGVARRGPVPMRGRTVMPEPAPAPPTKEAITPTEASTQIAPSLPAAEPAIAAPESLDAKVRAEKENVWADKAVMGNVRRGIPRNENFAMDVARERVMRTEVGQEAIADVLDRGIPADAMSDVAKMYRRAEGETPIAAFDAAVDRWVTKEEARAAAAYSDGDVATFDLLKAEADRGDPVLAEAFARLEEHYAGRKDLPAEGIPFGAESGEAPAGDRSAAAREPPAGRGSAETGGEPGGRSEVPAEPAPLNDGPRFSPRRTDTEPPGPALIETREAPASELSARQRQVEKERAQLLMQGKARKAGQESPDDLPLFGGDRQKTLFSPKREEPFYSALTRGVEGLKTAKASPGQWEATIRNMPGIKAEERAWSGVEEWLRSQPKSVTKEQVLDYLRAHEVRVEEVTHGGKRDDTAPDAVAQADHDAAWQALSDKINELRPREQAAHYANRTTEEADLRAEIGRLEGQREELHGRMVDETMARQKLSGKPTKFGSYVLPGGENYRELLLTLPDSDGAIRLALSDARRAQTEAIANYKSLREEIGQTSDPRVVAARAEWDSATKKVDDLNAKLNEGSAPFRGSHWDEPNVLAHVRFDDRTGPNGEKVLHLAEVQSDMHQSGRKQGYKVPVPQEVREAAQKVMDEKIQPGARYVRGGGKLNMVVPSDIAHWEKEGIIASQEAGALRAYDKAVAQSHSGVPDTPFKTTWPELAFKRMVRYASENGYDRLSWDTGATNADRFDLSKQIDAVHVSDRPADKEFDLSVKHKGDRNFDEPLNVAYDKLPDFVGKDLADKILSDHAAHDGKAYPSQEGYIVRNAGAFTKEYSGLDLKIGGEGMKSFYDKQLPVIANKLGKRFGAKTEDIAVGGAHRDEQGRFTTEDNASEKFTAHSIAISPPMRDSVLQGQPLFSPKRDFHANPDRTYTPEQERFNERQRAVEAPTWGDWWNKATANLPTRAAVALVDRYAGIKKRDPEGYVASRIANSSEGAKAVWLTEGTLNINGRAYDLKDRNGGARELLQPLKKEVYDFMFWIASHRAEELAKEDRENRFTPEDIKTGKTLNRGELDFDYTLSNGKTTRSREAAYTDSLAKLNALNQNILDLSVKGGLLTRETADVLMKNQFYVPFFRERADGTAEFVGPQKSSGMAKQTFGQKLTGGTEKLNSDLVQNWVDNASHIIDAVAKNRAAHAVLEAGMGDGIASKITEQEFNHRSDKQQKAQSTWVMVDGKKQYYHVEDPLLLKSVGTLSALADPFYALSASRVARRVLQVGVTHNPVFAIRNLARDSLQAMAVTPQSANVFKTVAEGIHGSDTPGALQNLALSMAGRDLKNLGLSDDAVRVLAGGGMMRIASLSDTGVSKVKLGSLLDTPEKLDGFLNGVGRAMHAYSEAVGAGETFNRIALYKKLRAEGVDHDIASFSAQDLTDFSLGGANVIVRYIRETVPFTNSRAQGLYKVGRALSGSDAAMFNALGASAAAPSAKSAAAVTLLRTAGTLAGLTVATMTLDAIYSDDPEYQQRSEYDRQNYWWFKVGDVRARVPMPFEVGALSRIAADTALAFFDDRMSVNRWASNTWSSMQNNLGFGFVPQVISPLLDLSMNKSGTGQAIEPRGMENLRPDQRYTIDNTMAARGASSAINSMLRALPGMGTVQGPSPMQLDYLTKAYGGWMSQASLGVADTAIRSFTSEPARPATDTWSEATQGLIETSPRNASRYVDALYQQAKSVEQAFATYKDIISREQVAEAREFFANNKDLIQRHGLMSGITRLEGDLNRQIRLVTNNPDPSVTPERKRLQIMQLQSMKNNAARQAMAIQ